MRWVYPPSYWHGWASQGLPREWALSFWPKTDENAASWENACSKINNPKATDWPMLSSFLQICQLETPFPPMGKNEREIGQNNCCSRNPFSASHPHWGEGGGLLPTASTSLPGLLCVSHWGSGSYPLSSFQMLEPVAMTGFVSSIRSRFSSQVMKWMPALLKMEEEDTADMLSRKNEESTKDNTCFLTPELGPTVKDTFSIRKL